LSTVTLIVISAKAPSMDLLNTDPHHKLCLFWTWDLLGSDSNWSFLIIWLLIICWCFCLATLLHSFISFVRFLLESFGFSVINGCLWLIFLNREKLYTLKDFFSQKVIELPEGKEWKEKSRILTWQM
jgi:hypothetical protein